jgi:hypothetical protein
MSALTGPDPGAPSFAPVAGFQHLQSDTPLLAALLLEDGGSADVRELLMPRVGIRLVAGPQAPEPLLPAVEPAAVIDPPTPPWIAMRRDVLAGRLKLDHPQRELAASVTDSGGHRITELNSED